MSRLRLFFNNLWDKIRGVEYDLELPQPYPMDKCWDCNTPTPPDCWQRFVVISGKEYSVPHCDVCMDKQEEQIRKANRERFGTDYPTGGST